MTLANIKTSLSLCGQHYIAGAWQGDACAFTGYNAAEFHALPWRFARCSQAELTSAVQHAEQAFIHYRQLPLARRAELLQQIADELLLTDELLPLLQLETGLTLPRLQGELQRTCNQLRLFATHLPELLQGSQLAADPQAQPPRPALRLSSLPLGPVAIFSASNFPLAFGVAGGDTASALAAGCAVLVKGHPAHPGSSELIMAAIARALSQCQLPLALVSLLQSDETAFSLALVRQPQIAAVAFTGSHQAGMALQAACQQRAVPVPFYGELGSLNPQLVLADLAKAAVMPLASQLVAACTGSAGQLCTKPGIWLLPAGDVGDLLLQQACLELATVAAQTMLHPGIYQRYQQSCAALAEVSTLLAQGLQSPRQASAKLFGADLSQWSSEPLFQQEVFGPAALVLRYQDEQQLIDWLAILPGQLCATVHGFQPASSAQQQLIETLSYKVGRVVFDQMPTGVAVCGAMHHGGPAPAATDIRSTAVGLAAIQRFIRPICWQNTVAASK